MKREKLRYLSRITQHPASLHFGLGVLLQICSKFLKHLFLRTPLGGIFVLLLIYLMLKLVCAIFYQIFIFSPNYSPLKTTKMFSISSKKLFSFSRYSLFCIFFPSFPQFSDSKGQILVEQFTISWTSLHKFAVAIWETTLHYIIKLGQIIYNQ